MVFREQSLRGNKSRCNRLRGVESLLQGFFRVGFERAHGNEYRMFEIRPHDSLQKMGAWMRIPLYSSPSGCEIGNFCRLLSAAVRTAELTSSMKF
jgi:hypothetical protein